MSYATLTNIDNAMYTIANSVLGDVVNGGVYHDGMRPIDSNAEDIVVKTSSGTIRQVQEFSVYVNVFIPDISNGSRHKVKDKKRLEAIENYGDELIEAFNEAYVGLYEAEYYSPTAQMKVHDIQQHFVSFNFKINCLTFNIE